jgi:hypothetical protein
MKTVSALIFTMDRPRICPILEFRVDSFLIIFYFMDIYQLEFSGCGLGLIKEM